MLYLKSWLEDYINLENVNNNELENLISTKSGEVEEIKDITDYFDNKLKIGQIIKCTKHPKSDNLTICKVNVGFDQLQLITKAKNVYEEMLVGVALDGCKLPTITINNRPILGEISQGMMISKEEVLLETTFAGIWDLKADLSLQFFQKELQKEDISDFLGKNLTEILSNLFPKETVLDIKFLPDKFSSFGSHLGLSLEIARLLEDNSKLKNLTKLILNPEEFWQKFSLFVAKNVKIEKPLLKLNNDLEDFCQQLLFLKIPNISNLLSNNNLLKQRMRLFLLNQNLTFNLADLSNYLLYDVGQPNHFADYDKIFENNQKDIEINLKKTTTETNFKGLGNLKNTILPKDFFVLTKTSNNQEEQLLWLPGISGNNSNAVSENTNNILVEIANFKAQNIAILSQEINYRSESSRFWTSKINLNVSFLACYQLHQLLSNTDFEIVLFWNQDLKLKDNTVEQLLAILRDIFDNQIDYYLKPNWDYLVSKITDSNKEKWLTKLQTKINFLGKYSIEENTFYPETFYHKIYTQEDLLFDLIRLNGYDDLSEEKLQIISTDLNSTGTFSFFLKDLAVKFGFWEVINRPFSKNSNQNLKLANSVNTNYQFLRSDLATNLLQSFTKNFNEGLNIIKIFELDKIYTEKNKENHNLKNNSNSPFVQKSDLFSNLEEKLHIGLITNHLDGNYVLTSFINYLTQKIKKNYSLDFKINKFSNNYGQGYLYQAEGIEIFLVEIKKEIKKNYKLPLDKRIWLTEAIFEKETDNFDSYNNYYNLSDYPLIIRDISLNIDAKLQLQDILKTISNFAKNDYQIRILPLERFIDTENSQRNICNLKLEFISYKKTLTSEEVEKSINGILTEIKKIDESLFLR